MVSISEYRPAVRPDLLEAAVDAFAVGGYYGTSTADVARRAGVSQPRIVQVFGTKLDLFIATHRYAGQAIMDVLSGIVEAPFDRMTVGRRYTEAALARPQLNMVVFHAFSACANDTIAAESRRLFFEILTLITERGEAADEDARMFMSRGMLINASLSMHLAEDGSESEKGWGRYMLGIVATPDAEAEPASSPRRSGSRRRP